MFDSFATVPISSSPAGIATTNPATHVANAGVRNRGWMREKMSGSRPSRDMANHTRACPSWNTRIDEIMPSMRADQHDQPHPVQAGCRDSQRQPLQRIHHRRRLAHHRSATAQCRVSTIATPLYSSVQTTSVARMPNGTSRCGLLHSSAAVETESNPI